MMREERERERERRERGKKYYITPKKPHGSLSLPRLFHLYLSSYFPLYFERLCVCGDQLAKKRVSFIFCFYYLR